MTEAVRAANPLIDAYVEGVATDVDIYHKKVTVQQTNLLQEFSTTVPNQAIEIPYDHLVVAVGTRVTDANVPGAEERCLRLKTTQDAQRLRTAVGECN